MTFEEANNMPAGREQIEAFGLVKVDLICIDCIHRDWCRQYDETIIRCDFYDSRY